LVEASQNRIGSAIDQVLLFCFHYDPTAGRYGAAVMNFVRAGGVLTVIGLLVFYVALMRGERRRRGLLAAAVPVVRANGELTG
jgi:protein SCO1/2